MFSPLSGMPYTPLIRNAEFLDDADHLGYGVTGGGLVRVNEVETVLGAQTDPRTSTSMYVVHVEEGRRSPPS